jgi:lysophospholipase L1-like esterase
MKPAFPLALLLAAGSLLAAEPAVQPTAPLSLSVRVLEGEFTTPSGAKLRVQPASLSFDPPELKEFTAPVQKGGGLPDAPEDYQPGHADKELWPKTLRLTPFYDANRTHILGGLYRTFRADTLVVTDEAGTKTYTRDTDYVYNEDWGLIANKDGRMTGKVSAKAQGAWQRLDLVQVDAAGQPSVRKGVSALVCPELPEPDAGHTALAGIYLAPWTARLNPHFKPDAPELAGLGAGDYAVTAHEILRIRPAAAVAPIHPENIAKTLAKLRAGQPVKIAFMGDSITLGAEATRWWEDKYDAKSTPWKGRFIHALRQRFPKSQITPMEAYQGGVTVTYGLEQMPVKVAPEKPDLVIAAFGANDADSPSISAPARTSPEDFAKAYRELTKATREFGGEMIYVTAFPVHPWLRNNAAERLEVLNATVTKLAAEEAATVIDVQAEYKNLNTRGIPYWSQNHNWTNHPGNLGHALYAETLLRAFPPSE